MKKSITLALCGLAMAGTMSADRWVPATSASDINGKDAIIVYYYQGTFDASGATSAPAKRAPMIVNGGGMRCLVMSDQLIVRTAYYGDFVMDALDVPRADIVFPDRSGKVTPTSIEALPENTAICHFDNTADGWTIKIGDKYLSPYVTPPTFDEDKSRLGIDLKDTPYYNRVNVGSDGAFSMTSTLRNDYNVFTMFTNYVIGGPSTAVFEYTQQKLDIGQCYVYVRENDLPLASRKPAMTPANGYETAPAADGLIRISVSWGDAQGTLNADKAITGTFNGAAIAANDITYSETVPAEIVVKVPENASGELLLNFPEGLYTLTKEGFESAPSSAIDYSCTVKVPEPTEWSYEFTPEQGYSLGILRDIAVTFDGCEAEMSEDAEYEATIAGEPVMTPLARNATEFTYTDELMGSGKYELVFKPGFWNLTFPNGAKMASPEIVYSVNLVALNDVIGGDDFTCMPEPKTVVDRLKSLTFGFENAEVIALSSGVDETSFTITHNGHTYGYENGLYEQEYQPYIITLVEGIYFNAATGDNEGLVVVRAKEGFWTLTMEDGSKLPSPEIVFCLYIGDPTGEWVSVEKFEAENPDVPVYDLNGVCISRNAKNMEGRKGFFIIDGKKVMIK